MSKTITIPTNCNPYIVVINNNVYTYKAGDTVEVPDEVAEAIEDALELVPKPKRYIGKLAQLAEGSISEITADDLEGITKIKASAFYNCRMIEKVVIPDNINDIDSHIFYSCVSLKSVTLGNGLKKIAGNVFEMCTNLRSVYLPETPPTLVNTNAFANINASCVFYCKTQESKDAYLSATNWSTLAGTYSFVIEE